MLLHIVLVCFDIELFYSYLSKAVEVDISLWCAARIVDALSVNKPTHYCINLGVSHQLHMASN